MADGTNETPTTKEAPSKYKPFTSEYDDFDGEAVKITHHFCKPGRKQLIALSKADKSKQFDTMGKVLGQLVEPKEKNSLEKDLTSEPMLVAAFADAIMKRCGAGSVELGN
ncbi:hypothetical protein [Desulfovibrio sp. UCD-KL4C]|uniref:hypothetical protein n=1 Tax=Desulfovibrio sp. UCD-KL4C TaxID=2578120 RepID=UPI0025C103E9|nr:hypothetical protein [Desulfovibrio sp. UCD-KL4C]